MDAPILLPQSVAPRRWGYLRPDGSWAMPPQFTFARPFSEGVAAVRKGDRMGYLRPDGSEALPFRYLRAGEVEKGRSEAETETGMGVIRPDGETAFPDRFETASPFDNGIAWCQAKGGRWGPFLREGGFLLPPIYDDPGWESGHFLSGWKSDDELENWFDRSGRIIVPAGNAAFGVFLPQFRRTSPLATSYTAGPTHLSFHPFSFP